MTAAGPSDHVTVIFDGTCGFCTRSVRYLRRLDRHQRLTAVACQAAKRDGHYDLEGVDCGESAWALAGDGRRESGAQAAMLIASTLSQQDWPVTIGRLPGIRHALAFGYRVIAINRHRLPGDTPWCSANPDRCEPG